MSNNLLTAIVLGVLVWTFFNVPAPEPVQQSVAWHAREGRVIDELWPDEPAMPLERNLPAMLVPPIAPESSIPKAFGMVLAE